MTGSAACWATVSLGGILLVRCTETGEHIAHQGEVRTEARPPNPRAQGVEMRHVIYWYDTGAVRVVEEVTHV